MKQKCLETLFISLFKFPLQSIVLFLKKWFLVPKFGFFCEISLLDIYGSNYGILTFFP